VTPTLSPPPALGGLSGGEIAEAVIGIVLVLVGLVVGIRTMAKVEAGDSGKLRTLISVHALAKAGFWIGLGAILLSYGFRSRLPGSPEALFPIPLVMAGLRLITSQALGRNLPPE